MVGVNFGEWWICKDVAKLFVKEHADMYGDAYDLRAKEREIYILNLLFMLFTRAKKRIICSYTNESDSIVYKYIKNAMNHPSTKKYFIKQSSSDVLEGDANNSNISQDEVDKRFDEVKSEFEKNFPLKNDSDDDDDDLPF